MTTSRVIERLISGDDNRGVLLETTLADDAGKWRMVTTGAILGSEEIKVSMTLNHDHPTEAMARGYTRTYHDFAWGTLMRWAEREQDESEEDDSDPLCKCGHPKSKHDLVFEPFGSPNTYTDSCSAETSGTRNYCTCLHFEAAHPLCEKCGHKYHGDVLCVKIGCDCGENIF